MAKKNYAVGNNHGKKIFRCLLCRYDGLTEGEIERHMREIHKENQHLTPLRPQTACKVRDPFPSALHEGAEAAGKGSKAAEKREDENLLSLTGLEEAGLVGKEPTPLPPPLTGKGSGTNKTAEAEKGEK